MVFMTEIRYPMGLIEQISETKGIKYCCYSVSADWSFRL